VPAAFAPHDQPHLGGERLVQGHRRRLALASLARHNPAMPLDPIDDDKAILVEPAPQLFPPEIRGLLDSREGGFRLAQYLPQKYPPESVTSEDRQEVKYWDAVGQFYIRSGRFPEALGIYMALFDHMIEAQKKSGVRCHKGLPLVWMSECYKSLGFEVMRQRYLMLTLIEDAIRGKGEIEPGSSGVYFRLVWDGGLTHSELERFAGRAYAFSKEEPIQSVYPERVLQELRGEWITKIPTPREAGVYVIHSQYAHHLLSNLGGKNGKPLEYLADYVLSCMPGCRTTLRSRTGSSELDVVCSMEGFEVDFRSELGRYFVCECKDWKLPADFDTMAKFCRVLDSTKAKFEGLSRCPRLLKM
jgi:hypothetical protein